MKLETKAFFFARTLRMVHGILRHYLEQHSGSGKKSTAVSTIIVMGGVAFVGTVAALSAGAPDWMLKIFAAVIIFVSVLYPIAYIYFMLKNPDALRSESFELKKMAMERGFYGDSMQGVISEDSGPKPQPVPADPPTQIEGSK